MGGWTARELEIKDDDGRSVLEELRRLGQLDSGTSGSSESESPSDDDDDHDTAVQRCFEDASKPRKIENVLARQSCFNSVRAASGHEGNSNAQEGHKSGAQPQRSAPRGSSIAWQDAPQHAPSQSFSLDRLAKDMQPVFRKAPALPRHGASSSFQTSDMKWFS